MASVVLSQDVQRYTLQSCARTTLVAQDDFALTIVPRVRSTTSIQQMYVQETDSVRPETDSVLASFTFGDIVRVRVNGKTTTRA